MEGIKYFNKDYFLLELQSAGAVKTNDEIDPDSVILQKVPNITIGLVLAARSLKTFENQIILNWIRKGRKLTALIEEQFDLYDKLSTYLQNNVCIGDDIQEWKQILNNTKYAYPSNEKSGWAQIFGDTPKILEKVNLEEDEIKQDNEGGTKKMSSEPKVATNKSGDSFILESNETMKTSEDKNEIQNGEKYFSRVDSNEMKSIEKSNLELSNLSKEERTSSELNVGDDESSDSDNDLDDLFNEVEAELNAAEENDNESEEKKNQSLEMTTETYISEDEKEKSKGEVLNTSELDECPLDDEVPDRHDDDLFLQKNELDIESDNEKLESKEEMCDNSMLEMDTTDDLFDFVEAELGAAEVKTSDDTNSNFVKVSEDREEKRMKKALGYFTLDYFYLELQKAGIISSVKEDFQNDSLNMIENLTFGHVIGVFALGTFPENIIRKWIIKSKGYEGSFRSGLYKRVSHYLLCAVPSNLADEWKECFKEEFLYSIIRKKNTKKESQAVTMFGTKYQKYGNLINCITKNDEPNSKKYRNLMRSINNDPKNSTHVYFRNKCSRFISGNCDVYCQYLHVCNNYEDCISILNSKDKNNTKDGAKSISPPCINDEYKFTGVTIFADEVYKPFLQHMEFTNDYQKVWLAADDELTPKNLKKIVPEYCKMIKGSKRQLCILVTGLYNLAPLQNRKVFKLPELPSIENLFFDYIYLSRMNRKEIRQQVLKKLLVKGWKCQRYVKNHLDPNAVVVMVPPLPGLITQYGTEYLEKEQCLIGSYQEFCTHWTRICCDMFTLQGLDPVIIKTYLEHSNQVVSVMNPSADIQDVKAELNTWFEMIQSILQSDYKPKIPIFCANFNRNLKCGKELCSYSHVCEICGQGGHGKARCHVLDNSICLQYNWGICNDVRCNLRHMCYACEQDHLVIDCKVNFMQHHSTFKMVQNDTPRMVRYQRVVLVGNQVALQPFILSRVPELKVIGNINHLVLDVNLDSHESSMHALYAMQLHMVKYPEFTSNTLWILISDMTNWLNYDSFCRTHFSDKMESCTEEIKMFYLKYDLPMQFYKAEDFVKSTLPYLGNNSAFILTPFIGQTVVCPPEICSGYDQSHLNLCPPGLEMSSLAEFHKILHNSTQMQKLQLFSPGVKKEDLIKYLTHFEQCWIDNVEKILKMQNIPLIVLNKYVHNKEEAFKVLDNVNGFPCPDSSYPYWDAFMVTLIKFLCDPLSEQVDLMCDFDKKVFFIKNKNGTEIDEKKKIISSSKPISLDDISFPEIALTKSIGEEITKSKDEEITNKLLKIKEKINKEKKSEKVVLDPKGTPKQSQESKLADIKDEERNKKSSAVSKVSTNKQDEVIEDAKKKIFVYNLPKELKNEDLNEMLKACGDIQDFDRELIENTEDKAALCSVKFANTHSVYRAYRLLNGRSVCSKSLSIVVPLKDSFTKKEKEVNKYEEVSEKQALVRIIEIVNKVEKKIKLLRSYLKSATMEKESKSQIKKDVSKEVIGKKESVKETKKKEEIVEKKLNEAFDLKAGSSPLFPCIAAEGQDDTKDDNLSSDEDKRSWSKEIDKRTKNKPYYNSRLEGKRNKEKERSKSPSHIARIQDRQDEISFSSKEEKTRRSDQKMGKYSENPRSSQTPLSSSSSKFTAKRSRSRSQGRSRRSRSRSRDRMEKSRSKDKNLRLVSSISSIDRIRSRSPDRIKRSRSRDRMESSRSKDKNQRLVSSISSIDKIRSRSRDRDRKRSSNIRDIDSNKSENRRLTEAEIKSKSGEFNKVREGRSIRDGVFYRDKAPQEDCETSERSRSGSREKSLSRLHNKDTLGKVSESMRNRLTPIQEDKSRSPRRYHRNQRSRSRSGTRSPVHHRRSHREREVYPSRQDKIPSAPPAPSFARSTAKDTDYNKQGLDDYLAMFGSSVSPGTSRPDYPSKSESTSYLHLSKNADQSKISNSVPDSSSSFSVLGVCNMLRSMCDQLDILGESLKIILEKAFEVKHNERQMLEIFAVDDHIMLMRMVTNRFSKLSDVAPDTQTKSIIENLKNQTKALIKKAEDSKISSSDQWFLYGIDVEKAASLTLNRNTSYIITHIKKELDNLGKTPTKEIVSRLALEISVLHFKMAATKDSFSSVDYGHSSSSSSLNKPVVSFDYGHGSTKSYGSSSTERNQDKNEDIKRSVNESEWEDVNRNPSPPGTIWCAGEPEVVPGPKSGAAAEVKWNEVGFGAYYAGEATSSGMPGAGLQQHSAVGQMYPSSTGNTHPGSNTWPSQGHGNMAMAPAAGNFRDQMSRSHVNYGTQPGQASGMQPWWPQN